MKSYFRIFRRAFWVCIGSYFLAIIITSFFPSQIATCNQLMTVCFNRICSWAPFIDTILRFFEKVWIWVLGIFPYYGTMCGTLIVFSLVKWVIKRR